MAGSKRSERPFFLDVFRLHVADDPERPALVYLSETDGEAATLSYGALDRKAAGIALALNRSVLQGDRALLIYPPGLDFVAAFLGCLYAGVVAVPISPPRPNRPLSERFSGILHDAAPQTALTTALMHRALRIRIEETAALRTLPWICTDQIAAQEVTIAADLDPEDLLLLQYTSGSSAAPKGVMVTHSNLFHNEQIIADVLGGHRHTRMVSWLPLYHDMGLMAGVLHPLFVGGCAILLSPFAFLQRPISWLRAIHQFRATVSGAPNFAYDLCARQLRPEQLVGIDLSSWECAFCGAEPIRADTLEAFAARLKLNGFRRESLHPCYGLAEATLCVTGGKPGAGPVIESFSTADLNAGAVRRAPPDPAQRLVGCGQVPAELDIRVVVPETGTECAPNQIGEFWVRGKSVARGYWNRVEETSESFAAILDGRPYLRTGDLGFILDGNVFVTGRLKDLIILRGRNIHPQDIELTVQRAHFALRRDAGAAFAIEEGGEERLVVVQELERQHRRADTREMIAAIRLAIAQQHEVQVHTVALVAPLEVPKTSSGKIQRRACRQAYLEGRLNTIDVWMPDASAAPRLEATPRTIAPDGSF